jgi:hypothetical protein
MRNTKMWLTGLLLLAMIGGCDDDNENAQVARVARESAAQQAAQNQEMAKLHREVATGTRQLVEADAQARQELILAQQQLAQQQADLAQQQAELAQRHDALDAERRELAEERYRESLLAPVISGIGLLVLCCLPLVLAWYLLQGWRQESTDETAIGNLLVEELVSQRPLLLPHCVLPPPIASPGNPIYSPAPQDADADASDPPGPG